MNRRTKNTIHKSCKIIECRSAELLVDVYRGFLCILLEVLPHLLKDFVGKWEGGLGIVRRLSVENVVSAFFGVKWLGFG